MGNINVLDKHVANLIAAGEVVERPASVIKELCENSIDSGATAITIEIQNGGISFMRVSDNGSGIEPSDMPLTILRHATSKIKVATDLNGIDTLGFRGEALAAIASVSKLRIISRHKLYDTGTLLSAEEGKILEVSETGASVGTSVIVEELFGNVPARRKFLKRDATETQAVAAVVEKMMLSHPEIAFKFITDGTLRTATSGDNKIANTIYATLGRDFASRLLPVNYMSGGIEVRGYIGRPDNVKSSRSYQNFFLNRRFVKCKTFIAGLEQAFVSYIPSEKFPCCVLYVSIHPALLDVNVHPTKLEVKFADEKAAFEAVYYAVRSTLEHKINPPQARLAAFEETQSERNPVTDFTSYKDIVKTEKSNTKSDADIDAPKIVIPEPSESAPAEPAVSANDAIQKKLNEGSKLINSFTPLRTYETAQKTENKHFAVPGTLSNRIKDGQSNECPSDMPKVNFKNFEKLLKAKFPPIDPRGTHKLFTDSEKHSLDYTSYDIAQAKKAAAENKVYESPEFYTFSDYFLHILEMRAPVRNPSKPKLPHKYPPTPLELFYSDCKSADGSDIIVNLKGINIPTSALPRTFEEFQKKYLFIIDEYKDKNLSTTVRPTLQKSSDEKAYPNTADDSIFPTPEKTQSASAKFDKALIQDPAPALPSEDEHTTAAINENPDELPASTSKIPFYKIIGELFNSYVIVELSDSDSTLLIDKHAAHERLIFEQMKANMKQGADLASQLLLIPYNVKLPPMEYAAFCDFMPELRAVGFEFEVTDEHANDTDYDELREVKITAAPVNMPPETVIDSFCEMVSRLAEGTGSVETSRDELYEKALYQASCKAAIKAGRIYDSENIRWLCDRLFELDTIRFCPHGRPVAVELTRHELERMFKRI